MTPLTPAPQFLKDVTTPRVLTLLYHRINNLASDPQSLSVKPHNFEQHLTVLKDSYRVAKFAQLAESESSRKTPVNTVIVTFDDGYTDNLIEAVPLLKQADIAATIFVTSGMVQHQKHFWWDELDYIVLGEHKLPRLLQIRLDENYSWDLGEDCEWSTDRRNIFSQWCVLEENDPTVRHEIYRRVSGYLRDANEDKRTNILQFLSTWAGVAPQQLKSQVLTQSQLKTIGDCDLIEIGSHTVHHPVMSKISAATQRKELEESKSYLESVVNKQIESFAYPYGTKSDYTAETVSLVRDTKYTTACVNIAEATWPGTDRFQIPRLLVRDCPGDVFAKWLAEWFGQS